MTVNSATTAQTTAQTTAPSSGGANDVQLLESQAKDLTKQIQSVEKDNSLDAQAKAEELVILEAELVQVQVEIQQQQAAQEMQQQKAALQKMMASDDTNTASATAPTGNLISIKA